MASTIKIKNSSTAGAAPTASDLVQGELAVNVTDKRIYTENASGTVVELGTNPSIPVTFPDGSASAPSLTNDGDTNTGVFFPAADTVGITTGGTERARIDSSGNLGLGVTPSASAQKTFEVGFAGSSLSARAANLFELSNNAYYNSGWKYGSTGNAATVFEQYNGSFNWLTAASGTAGDAISFTQAMTLDASGNLLVGTTSNSYGSLVGKITSASASGGAGLFYTNFAGDVSTAPLNIGKIDNNSTTSQVFVKFGINNGGLGSGQINANGASSAAFGSFSDRRIKENIVELPSQLANIMALRPVEFDYVESYGGGHQIGFIAQEMEQVYSDAVSEDDSEQKIKSITGWSKTEARLVKAIQEQQAMIASQSELITQLQADVAALKAA